MVGLSRPRTMAVPEKRTHWGAVMFYHEMEEDEWRVLADGCETPFTLALRDDQYRDPAEAAGRLGDEAEEAAGWLALQGMTPVRVDKGRGRLWVDREASGKVYWTLLGRYRVRREAGYNLVEPG